MSFYCTISDITQRALKIWVRVIQGHSLKMAPFDTILAEDSLISSVTAWQARRWSGPPSRGEGHSWDRYSAPGPRWGTSVLHTSSKIGPSLGRITQHRPCCLDFTYSAYPIATPLNHVTTSSAFWFTLSAVSDYIGIDNVTDIWRQLTSHVIVDVAKRLFTCNNVAELQQVCRVTRQNDCCSVNRKKWTANEIGETIYAQHRATVREHC